MKIHTPHIHGLLPLIAVLLLFVGCGASRRYIDTYAVRTEQGTYTISWDTDPSWQGTVEIFVSPRSSSFPSSPAIVERIDNQVATYMVPEEYTQQFFLLVFDGRESVLTSVRRLPTEVPLNLRDLGGYITVDDKRVRWERLYRSGALTRLTRHDSLLVQHLGIATQLILSDRMGGELSYPLYTVHPTQILPSGFDYYHDLSLDGITAGKMTAEQVREHLALYLRQLITHNARQYRTALEYMLYPQHYPMLLSDEYGKDRVAVFVMLLQGILGVSHSDIVSEYTQSNYALSPLYFIPNGHDYPASVQEALTEYFRCRPNDFHTLLSLLDFNYGDIPTYVEEVIGFDKTQQAALRALLLQ